MNPKSAVYPQTRNEVIATPCIVGDRMYIANGQDPEHGEGYGHLYCVDITKEGDISKESEVVEQPKAGATENAPVDIRGEARQGKPNPNSGVIWEYEQFDLNKDGKIDRSEHMNRTISTCLVSPKGLVFAADFSGFLHCLDAKTGQVYWTFDMESAMWGSPMWADGKVYVTDEDGDVRIFADDKEMKKLSPEDDHLNLGSASFCSPVFVNGILYLSDRDTLYAIKTGAQSTPAKPAAEKPEK
jgi:outer membrane protein assembly factor BamB